MKKQTNETFLFQGAGSFYWHQEKGRVGGTCGEAAGVKSDICQQTVLHLCIVVATSQRGNQWLTF